MVDASVKFLTMASSKCIPASVSEIATYRLPRMLQLSPSWWALHCDLVTSFDWETTADGVSMGGEWCGRGSARSSRVV